MCVVYNMFKGLRLGIGLGIGLRLGMGLGIGLGSGFEYFRQYNVIRRNGAEPNLTPCMSRHAVE